MMRKVLQTFFSLFLLLSIGTAQAVTLDSPVNLEIKGSNYNIKTITKGALPFINRTNLSFNFDIPSEIKDWQYTQLNAFSTYLPGPDPSISVKPLADGNIYALVENMEKPDVCAAWATANGWTLVDGFVGIKYGDKEFQTTFLYKKSCIKDEWVNIAQPATFSRAIICAPSIKQESTTVTQTIAVNLTAGNLQIGTMGNGATVFTNRPYVFENVPAFLQGLDFTCNPGGGAPAFTITAEESGDIYICFAASGEDNTTGWTLMEDLAFNYNDGTKSKYNVYKRAYTKGETIRIEQKAWAGAILLATKINYKKIVTITPPPGVVVHNSPAETHKYVGSPSIVIMPDGTYVASHDYFGGIISDSYVYNSTDKGLTWKPTAKLTRLNWSTLFNRGNELYLIGVAPNCVMGYGDIVILKSMDNGTTWTSPTNATNGLLFPGFYHCAPVPVINYNGKIWRAFENMGSAGGWGPFSALMFSIDQNIDLLVAENWTKSNELTFQSQTWKPGATAWLEGNAVVDRDGNMKDILRVAYGKDDVAAMVSISDDGKRATFNPNKNFINFPGAAKKFTIRFDSVSNKYWSLSNFVLEKDRYDADNGSIRNTQVLMWSDNLTDWNIKDTVLTCNNPNLNGFQYVDWQFDGEDIVFVSRTAWEDETGFPPRQHDANYLTFHRIEKFRYDRIAIENIIKPKTWYKGYRSALALTFDDGFRGHYKYAYPTLQKYEMEGTFFVITSKLVDKGTSPIIRYGVWDEFAEMAENGMEIGSHTLTHPNLVSSFDEALTDEIKKSKEIIDSKIPAQKCVSLAYPFCLRDEHVDVEMAKYYLTGRTCGTAANSSAITGMDWFSVKSELLTWINPRSLDNEKEKANRVIDYIKNDVIKPANFGVYCIHEVLPLASIASITDGYEICSNEWLDIICKEMAAQREAGKLWPTSLGNIVKYAKERENLKMYTVEKSLSESLDTFVYAFTDGLDDEIFNLPLTVDITLPTTYKSLDILINGNVVKEGITNSLKATIDIIPDVDVVTLKVKKTLNDIESVQANRVSFFPNPFSDVLSLETDQELMNARVSISDLTGRVVFSSSLGKIEANSRASLNTGKLNSGIYLIEVWDNNQKIKAEKLVAL